MIHEEPCLNIQTGACDEQHEGQPSVQTELYIWICVSTHACVGGGGGDKETRVSRENVHVRVVNIFIEFA